MSDQWERFAKRNRELAQEDFGFEDSVVIETPTESYTAGKGYSTTYSSEGTFSVELNAPSSTGDQSEGGTTQTADLIAHIPDDLPGQLSGGLDGYGDSGDAPAHFLPVSESDRYEVVTKDPERNGTIRVVLSEVDTRG